MLQFKKKKKKNTCRCHYQNHDHIIYSSWDIEQNKLKFPLRTPKIKILKNEKLCWGYHHFIHGHQKSQSYDVWFLRYRQNFLSFWVIFALLPSPLMISNIKIKKKQKKMAGYIILLYIPVYHKWRSYDIWFLKFLTFWAIFCPFSHLTTWKIKVLKKWKKQLEILSFYTFAP